MKKLITFVTAGDPPISELPGILRDLEAGGADLIEVGIPFSDPIADGPVIQRASERALKNKTSLAHVIELAGKVRRARANAGIIIFSYWNPVLRFGLSRVCDALSIAGIDGAVITDLTVEESKEYSQAMRAKNLDTIFLAAPTSTDERLRAIAAASSGFIYAVSRTCISGTHKQLSDDAQQLVKRIRRYTQLPIAVGFGISNAEQFANVGTFADAAVIGSAIVHIVELNGSHAPDRVAEFIRGLRAEAGKNWALAHP